MNQLNRGKKTYYAQLQECLKDQDTVEVMTKPGKELKGKISIVGSNYIGIVYNVTVTTEVVVPGEDKKQKKVEIHSLETFIKFEEIEAITRVIQEHVK